MLKTDLLDPDQEEEEWKSKLEEERARQNNKIIPKTNYQEYIYAKMKILIILYSTILYVR